MLRRLRAWLRMRASARGGRRIVRLYTKADCPLCERLKAELGRARVEPPFRIVEVDIERNPELRARYGLSIPVLELEGRLLVKGRATASEFERRYARVVAEIAATRLLPDGSRRESRHD